MSRRFASGILLVTALSLVLTACGAPRPPVNGIVPRVLSVSIDQGDFALELGESRALTATVEAEGGATDAVLWGSDAPAVATVSASGVVTAVGEGEAVITATSVFDSTRSDSITVEVVGVVDFVVDAQGETLEPTPLETFTVGAGETVVLEVRFPPSGADLMYVEIQPEDEATGLRIELRGETGDELELVSRSPSIFATSPGVLPLTAAAAVDRSSLSVQWNCFGPCVARPYRSGTSYVHVVNDGPGTRSVTFYAYGFVAADENEPNDTPATATNVVAENVNDTVTGAIEHVEDRDYFRITCDPAFPFENLRLELTSTFEGDIALVANDEPYRSGEETPVLPCNTIVFVHTLDGTAGASAHSGYTITIR
jgi:hypothetical protein